MQGAHLIVHECNEGRDHNGDAQASILTSNGGNLVAQAFAAASGHENQRVLAASDVFNDVLLWPAESLIAKDLAEDAQYVG